MLGLIYPGGYFPIEGWCTVELYRYLRLYNTHRPLKRGSRMESDKVESEDPGSNVFRNNIDGSPYEQCEEECTINYPETLP